MSAKCFETCTDMSSWIASTETGKRLSDWYFVDDIQVIMGVVAQATPRSAAAEPVRHEAKALEIGYIKSLFDGCFERSLDGLWVLSAIAYAASETDDCTKCPFKPVQVAAGE